MSKIIPSINGFSLKNFNQVEASDFNIKFSGDICYEGKTIGEYNQWYREDKGTPKEFIKFTDEGTEIAKAYKYYVSMFEYPISDSDKEEDSQIIGISIMLEDLGILTYLYGHMNNACPKKDFDKEGLIGIVASGKPYFIKILDKSIIDDKVKILDFIKTKIPRAREKRAKTNPQTMSVFQNCHQ